MHPMLNTLQSEPTDQQGSDAAWAAQAVQDLFAGLKLNQRLVTDGVWDQYIADMETDADLSAYGTFLIGLRDSLVIAKKVRGR